MRRTTNIIVYHDHMNTILYITGELGRLTDTSSTGYVTINNHKAIFVFDRHAPPYPIILPQCQNDPKRPLNRIPL